MSTGTSCGRRPIREGAGHDLRFATREQVEAAGGRVLPEAEGVIVMREVPVSARPFGADGRVDRKAAPVDYRLKSPLVLYHMATGTDLARGQVPTQPLGSPGRIAVFERGSRESLTLLAGLRAGLDGQRGELAGAAEGFAALLAARTERFEDAARGFEDSLRERVKALSVPFDEFGGPRRIWPASPGESFAVRRFVVVAAAGGAVLGAGVAFVLAVLFQLAVSRADSGEDSIMAKRKPSPPGDTGCGVSAEVWRRIDEIAAGVDGGATRDEVVTALLECERRGLEQGKTQVVSLMVWTLRGEVVARGLEAERKRWDARRGQEQPPRPRSAPAPAPQSKDDGPKPLAVKSPGGPK